MNRPVLMFLRLSHAADLPLPAYETPLSAGMDLRAALIEPVDLHPGERKLIPTGLKIAVPAGYEGQVRPRSGLAIKQGITMLNSPGTIDADYRGEVMVIAINHGQDVVRFNHGDRIAQLVVVPVVQVSIHEVAELDATDRGEGGFGSTGVK
jgi:dUTP pyrophosphatase